MLASYQPPFHGRQKEDKGQVFTPPSIVKSMLDYCKYRGQDVLNRHIIDNSCGNGAFLCEIAERYVRSAKAEGWKNSEISGSKVQTDLQRYRIG